MLADEEEEEEDEEFELDPLLLDAFRFYVPLGDLDLDRDFFLDAFSMTSFLLASIFFIKSSFAPTEISLFDSFEIVANAYSRIPATYFCELSLCYKGSLTVGL